MKKKAALKTFHVTDAPSTIFGAVVRDGGVIVRDMLTPQQVSQLNTDLDVSVETSQAGRKTGNTLENAFYGTNTKRFTRLIQRSDTFVEVLEHELMHLWAKNTLLKHASSYWLNTAQAMIVGPGSPAQYLHRDQDNWPIFSKIGREAPQATISCMFALTDFTEERGATRVVPGSHRSKAYWRPSLQAESVPAEMSTGSGLLYYGNTVHGAGANKTTDHWRRAIHMSFVLGYLTPEEASPLEFSVDDIRKFSPLVRKMLGYASHNSSPGGGKVWMIDVDDVEKVLNLEGGVKD